MALPPPPRFCQSPIPLFGEFICQAFSIMDSGKFSSPPRFHGLDALGLRLISTHYLA